MNAMSVSPVKPTINPGNHAVPATATNLTKSPLPSGNFSSVNLIPEAKSIPTVNAAPVNTENSIDLCSKPPTSNGIVSPTAETNIKENSANIPQNHNEKSDPVLNLITTDAPQKPVEVVSEIKNVEKPKTEEPKNIAQSNDNSASVKEVVPVTPVELAKEAVKDEKLKTEEIKPEPVVVNDIKDGKESESHQTEVKASEPVPESKKETKSTPEKSLDKKESESEANNEKNVQSEESGKELLSESSAVPKPTKRKAKVPVEPVEDDGKEGRKSKRVRLPTQPYQSPIPELQFIAKLQTPTKATPKPTTEKIIAFFKNEFLAVRNPEGSFYICQTFQNIHRNSTRIKIRWFTNLPNDVFTPDFFDVTEFDCILTNVQMTRVEKDRWKLPEVERTRVENILKRALDVEKGVAEQPSITEEHPDGLDLSLFKDEAQLKKKKKKKSASPKANKETAAASGTVKKPASSKSTKSAKTVAPNTSNTSSTKKSARLSNLSQTSVKETASQKSGKLVENKTIKDKKKKKGKHGAAGKASSNTKQNDKAKVWEPSVKSSNSSKVVLSLKKETPPAVSKTNAAETTTKAATKRTSSVSSRASATNTSPAVVPQKRRKDESKSAAANQPTTNERTGKVRNAGSAVTAKINSAAMRTTKEKERKVSNSSSQRKK